MSHVLLITWGGDFQGTAIVRKLKDYIYNKYVQKVCSEEADEAIGVDEYINRYESQDPEDVARGGWDMTNQLEIPIEEE